MKKIGFVLSVLGILFILIFALADFLGLGRRGELGAAQLLGIEIGILLILIGIGFVIINWNGEWKIRKHIRLMLERILAFPPAFWVVSTFLVLYILFFICPMFFSSIKIQYFVRYIPDAWVTRIGFDIETTVRHMENWLITKQSPYSDGTVPYSPLTLAIFAPLAALGYPGYYKLVTIITIVCYIFTTLLVPGFVRSWKNYALLLLFSSVGLFSYGFQFEMERGQFNVIAFALCLSAIYIYHYHHQFRFFAYLLFSLSIQLKLYPLIFTVMFIRDWRDWRNNILRIVALGVFNFSLLFVLGYQLFVEFIQNIIARQLQFRSSQNQDLSIGGFVDYLTTEGFGPVQANTLAKQVGALEMFFLILFGACLTSMVVHIFIHKFEGMNIYLLAVCTLGALIIPTASFDYKLPILVAPMALMLSGLPVPQTALKKLVSSALVIILSLAYWSTLYPYNVKPEILSRNFPALLVILFSISVLYFLFDGRSELRSVDT